jgi:probable F420-dependent oxidoreductase
MVSDKLRIGSLLFDNDFRHPAVLAKAAASLDVLSGGRLELGIGAGWLKEEYDQTGIPFDPASVRIERMVEAVRLIKRIFTEEHPVSFAGTHYTVTDLICPPHPVQKPHPPFIIGGGSKRILTVAGQEADIVGITTRARHDGTKDTSDNTADLSLEKIGWIRDAAGERFDQIELNVIISDVVVTDDRKTAAEEIAIQHGTTTEEVLISPQILIGRHEEMAEQIQANRERYGFSYIVVTEFNMDKFAPVVGMLAGT